MNKSNIFRSSDFFMAIGDVLHILIRDISGTPVDTIILIGEAPATVPGTPVALPATDILDVSFTANWYYLENSNGYLLDVATDIDFTTFVIDNLDVGNVSDYSVTTLDPETEYFYRIRAYNDYGTSVNSNIIEVTTTSGIVGLLDYDGNIYTTVVIGVQEWIVQNLRVTHYENGDPIQLITDQTAWLADTNGAYCYYNNDINNVVPYGVLYNWFAVDHGSWLSNDGLPYFTRNSIKEVGWHIPSKDDFDVLITYLGTNPGGKLKEIGTSHWLIPNVDATNETGVYCVTIRSTI